MSRNGLDYKRQSSPDRAFYCMTLVFKLVLKIELAFSFLKKQIISKPR